MNCILVVNVGNKWCSNARSSVTAAAHRWGADLVEVTGRHPDTPIWGLKHRVIVDRLQYYDHVFHVDTDVLISARAPSVFEFAGEHMCGVPDNQSHYDERMHQHIHSTVYAPHINWLRDRGHHFVFGPERFINSGVFLASTKAAAFRYFLANCPHHSSWPGPHVEQAMFNVSISQTMQLRLLDERWNRLAPPQEVPMEGFVYHFTGANFNKKLVESYDWQSVPQ